MSNQGKEEIATSCRLLKLGANFVKNTLAFTGDSGMQTFWTKYQKEFDYAKDVSFDETCHMVLKIISAIKL